MVYGGRGGVAADRKVRQSVRESEITFAVLLSLFGSDVMEVKGEKKEKKRRKDAMNERLNAFHVFDAILEFSLFHVICKQLKENWFRIRVKTQQNFKFCGKITENNENIVKNEQKLEQKVEKKVLKKRWNGDQNGEKVDENHQPLNAPKVYDLSEDQQSQLDPQEAVEVWTQFERHFLSTKDIWKEVVVIATKPHNHSIRFIYLLTFFALILDHF